MSWTVQTSDFEHWQAVGAWTSSKRDYSEQRDDQSLLTDLLRSSRSCYPHSHSLNHPISTHTSFQQLRDTPYALAELIMDSLPVETFSTILRMAIEGETRSSRYSTLRACSLVCSGWHDIAQVELWRRVEVLGSTWTAFMSTLLSGEKPKPVLKDLRLSEMSSGQVVSIFSIVKGIEKLVLDRVVGFDAAMFALPMLAGE